MKQEQARDPPLCHSDNQGGDGASGGERGGERRLRAPLHLSGAGWPGWDCALSLSPARGGIGFSPGNFPHGPGSQREEAAAWPGPDGGDGGAQMLQALGQLAGEPWAPEAWGAGWGPEHPHRAGHGLPSGCSLSIYSVRFPDTISFEPRGTWAGLCARSRTGRGGTEK